MRTHIGTWQGAALATVMLALVAASTAWAQVPLRRAAPGEQPARRFNQNQPQQNQLPAAQRVTTNRQESAPTQVIDRQIANWLALCNQEEVEMGKLASSKAKDEKVREFADHVVKGHGELLKELQPFGATTMALRHDGDARDATVAAPAAPGGNAARDERVAQPNRPQAQTRTGANMQGGLDYMNVSRQIAQQCLNSAEKAWKENKAEECDMSFIGHQIVAHEQMLSTQKVLKQYASPELQVVIDKGIQSAEDHLAQAKDLIHQLDKKLSDASKD